MLKKKIIFCILLLMFLFVGTSCASELDLNYLKLEAKEKVSLSYEDKNEEGYVTFLKKLDTFYASLSEELYNEYGKKYSNICVSPVSIYMALALTIECSAENTRNELLNAIGVTYEEVKTYTKRLYAQMNQEFTQINEFGQKEVKALELLTNSIWFEESIALKEVGLTNLANYYNCSSYAAPFSKNNHKANQALRDYVKRNTKGLIDRDFQLSKDALIALVNTLYLKDIWNSLGDELTFTKEKYSFKNYNDQIQNLELLQGYYNTGKVIETETFNHFYTMTNHGFKLKFIVPKDDYTVDDIYTKEVLEEVNRINDYQAVNDINKTISYTRCLFPEFKANFNEDITKIIKNKFNVNDLFNYKTCNFSNIVDETEYLDKYPGIYCSTIIHQTELSVNKKGIEGAAVTIVAMDGATDNPIEDYQKVYYDFVINRDFVFMLTDSSDVVLFTGVVKNI